MEIIKDNLKHEGKEKEFFYINFKSSERKYAVSKRFDSYKEAEEWLSKQIAIYYESL